MIRFPYLAANFESGRFVEMTVTLCFSYLSYKSSNNKVKAVKRSMYGRAKNDLLLIKITLYSRKYVHEN